jgi:hypothetical protein
MRGFRALLVLLAASLLTGCGNRCQEHIERALGSPLPAVAKASKAPPTGVVPGRAVAMRDGAIITLVYGERADEVVVRVKSNPDYRG